MWLRNPQDSQLLVSYYLHQERWLSVVKGVDRRPPDEALVFCSLLISTSGPGEEHKSGQVSTIVTSSCSLCHSSNLRVNRLLTLLKGKDNQGLQCQFSIFMHFWITHLDGKKEKMKKKDSLGISVIMSHTITQETLFFPLPVVN